MTQSLKILINFWLIITLFESPIRYLLYLGGVPQLIYIKDVIILFILLIGLLNIFLIKKINKIVLYIIILVMLGVVFSVINKLNVLQIIFGLKVFLPFLSGFIIAYYYPKVIYDIAKLSKYYLIISSIGIILDYFVNFPWKGLNYSIMSYEVEGNRSWTTFGIERLSGFQRSSFDAAIFMYILLLLNYIYRSLNKPKGYINLFNFLLYLLGIISILLTTSKSSYIALLSLLIIILFIKSSRYFKNSLSTWLTKAFLFILFLNGIIPPIISLIYQKNYHNKYISNVIYFISQEKYQIYFASYLDRIYNTWPNSLDLLFSSITPFFGRGIGGIGASQQFFEPLKYNFADNIYVYLFVTYGVFAVFLFLLIAGYVLKLKKIDKNNYIITLLLSTIFTFGATINYIESTTLLLFTGVFLAYQFHLKNYFRENGYEKNWH